MTTDLFVGSLMILTLAAIAIFSLTTRRRNDREDKWSGLRTQKDDENNRPGN